MQVPSLPELQNAFAASLMGDESNVNATIDGAGLAPEARLQIYRNIVFNNLTAALETAYPVIRALVGEAFFDAAAARYIRRRPSGSGKLQDFGAEFADLLAHMPEAGGLPYLGDVAHLEWARQDCVLAPIEPVLDAARLLGTPAAERLDLRLYLQSALRLVHSDYPILDIWLYCQEEREERLDIQRPGQSVLVWRSESRVAMQVIDSALDVFLHALGIGKTLALASEDALDADPAFDPQAAITWLLHEGIATDFSV